MLAGFGQSSDMVPYTWKEQLEAALWRMDERHVGGESGRPLQRLVQFMEPYASNVISIYKLYSLFKKMRTKRLLQ